MILKKKKSSTFALIYVAVDLIAVIAGFISAYYLRFQSGLFTVDDIPSFSNYLSAMIISAPIFLILFRNFRLYQSGKMQRRWDVVNGSLAAVTFGMVLCMAVTFIYRQGDFDYSRLFVVLSWALILIYFNLFRFTVNKIERKNIRRKGLETRVVILGINKTSRKIIHWIKAARYSGYRVQGIYAIGDKEKGLHIQNCEILGDIKDFYDHINDLEIDEVILTEPKFSREETAKMMLACEANMINFKVIADMYGLVTSSVDVETINTVPVLGLKQLPLDDLWNRFTKRFFDLIGSGAGLIVCLPLFAILALIIKLENKGPVFYRQERMGKNGKSFLLVKFRTMSIDAEKETGPVWTREGDERCTRVGSFLRKTNTDELPQLWNVFLGQMSLVGPRPERPFFVEQFKAEIPRYMVRHQIKPGITGWAQVYGYRGDVVMSYKGREKSKMGIKDLSLVEVDEEKQHITERIQLDLYYLENWSLLFDVEILIRTVAAFKNAF